jgi:two-component system, OmpR family, osmolarity sensor histidine kinase EnvZ
MATMTAQRLLSRAPRLLFRRLMLLSGHLLPRGLYARALIIIIAPIVLLESVVAFVFMERHWDLVTQRLSQMTAGNMAALIDTYDESRDEEDRRRMIDYAIKRFSLGVELLPPGELPPTRPAPMFDLLDRALSAEIARQVDRPFWIDTVSKARTVEVQFQLGDAIMRVTTPRNQTYASNSHIFIVWMVGTSLVLLSVAIMFLRNQIKPILRLAEAAEAFGKGRPVSSEFKPRGALEVRQAAFAFIEMRDRIERHMEQRTTMLAGVSHDLRTVLTRFKLQLALVGDNPDTQALHGDVDEMQLMLEDYMAFAKGGMGEEAKPVEVRHMLSEICTEAARLGKPIELKFRRRRHIPVMLRRHGFKRAIANLVSNACRYADHVVITSTQDRHWLRIEVDDDGPGIEPEKREAVFRPFYRLEEGRNQDEPNTGLGLAIARDIARIHGGDIWLEDSELGGLKAVVRVPV